MELVLKCFLSDFFNLKKKRYKSKFSGRVLLFHHFLRLEFRSIRVRKETTKNP